jgi:hypothetical protein
MSPVKTPRSNKAVATAAMRCQCCFTNFGLSFHVTPIGVGDFAFAVLVKN